MALDFDKFIVDCVDRVVGISKSTGECDFILDEIKDATIENGEDIVYLTGKNGTRIGALSRNKTSKFSCNNGFFVGGAMATQIGDTPTIASSSSKLTVPNYEIIDVPAGATTVVLEQIPVGITGNEIPFIYKANSDGTQGEKYAIASTASATEFSLVPATKTITLPTGSFASAGQVIAIYDYETEVGKKYVNSGDKFSKTEKLIIDMTLRDVCDNSAMYHGKMVFQNAKVDGSFTISVQNEPQAHAFSAEAMSNVCSTGKEFWSFTIVE